MTSLDLGGYGAYVWPAYGAAAVVLIVLLLASLRRVISVERRLTQLQTARLVAVSDLSPPQARDR